MFGIIGMRAGRRLSVEFKARKIEFLQTNLAGVKTHHRVLADGIEKFASRFLTCNGLRFVGEWLKKSDLFFRHELNECFAVQRFAMRIEPGQPGAKAAL